MKKKIVSIILMSLLCIQALTGCQLTERKFKESQEETTEEPAPDAEVYQDILDSEIASGLMQFGNLRIELGDKIFKFEDAGLQCRENTYDTQVEPYEYMDLVLYITVPITEDTATTEYVYLRGYNDKNYRNDLRNCVLTSIYDDKANKLLHLGVSKGIIYGTTKKTLVERYGKTDSTSEDNNSKIYAYTNNNKICSVYVSKSTGLVERIKYERTGEEEILVQSEE